MASETLERARTYEESESRKITSSMRPAFHLTPYVGWMNDPNGFSYYKGKYHMFYQYHPYNSQWGPMHWGHAVSNDLLHWEYLPAAIAPDMPYDNAGCFSGSAIELPDGRQLLMYTGVHRETMSDGTVRDIQTQCLAVGDGLNYTKYEGNPVLTEKDLPEGASKFDFRDPKMWREENGTYMAIVGNRPADGSGQFLLFKSEDAFHWSYMSTVDENRNRFGKMWECPDLFSLDGKDVILTSPQDMLPVGYDYYNGNGTLCLIGHFYHESGIFTEESDQTIDHGIDFYAPQTVLTPDGRRIMIGWMQNWDSCGIREPEAPWAGQMSLPRELSIKNGRLCQKPSREFDALRNHPVSYQNILVENDVHPVRLPGIDGRVADVELSIRPEDMDKVFRSFTIRLAEGGSFHTDIKFRTYEGTLRIDRMYSGSRRAIIHQRKCGIDNAASGLLKLRIVLDRYSGEIFIGDGEKTMTVAIYTDLAADGISFLAHGNVLMDVSKYDIQQ